MSAGEILGLIFQKNWERYHKICCLLQGALMRLLLESDGNYNSQRKTLKTPLKILSRQLFEIFCCIKIPTKA